MKWLEKRIENCGNRLDGKMLLKSLWIFIEKIIGWSLDRSNSVFLIAIGMYRDTPYYYDMSYKQRIIRMEIVERIESAANDKVKIIWNVYNIYIPKSVWPEKERILIAIKDAFSVVRGIVPEEEIEEINVEVKCIPQCVEVDYNGK